MVTSGRLIVHAPVASLSKKTPYVADTEIGIGGTSAWRCCTMDTKSTYAFYFECANQQATNIPPGSQRYFVSTVTAPFVRKVEVPSGLYLETMHD